DTVVPYSGGQAYHFRMEIDLLQKRYSVFVTPPATSEIALATNYAFRGEQAALATMDNRGDIASIGSVSVSSFHVTSNVGSAWDSGPFPAQTSKFRVDFDAVPSSSPMDGVTGLSSGAASAFTSLAAIVRFAPSGSIDARNGGAYAATTSVP